MGTSGLNSCWYETRVVHVRHTPRPHRLVYRVPYFLLDLEELPRLERELRMLGVERRSVFSFYAADHLDGRGPIGARLRAFLLASGLPAECATRVRLLTLCRQWGYVFNPVSFFFLLDAQNELRALLAEVNNTFGERFHYLLDLQQAEQSGRWWRARADKVMHVSPFVRREQAHYEFRWHLPAQSLHIHIRACESGRPTIDATLSGVRRSLQDRALLGAALRFPWSTVKVTAAIHWEALKLYAKRISFLHQPPPSPEQQAQQQLWRRL